MEFENILNLSGELLKEHILTSPNRKELLQNNQIREKLFENKNHYAFVWIVQELKNDEILYLCDKNLLPFLEKDSRRGDKINAIVSSSNYSVTPFLVQPTVLSYIYDVFSTVDVYLKNYDFSFSLAFTKYLIKNHSDKLYYICYLNSAYFSKIIEDKTVRDYFLNEDDLSIFMRYVSVPLLQTLMIYPKFKKLFLNSSLDEIDRKMERGIVLPLEFLKNEEFLLRYIENYDVTLYRTYIENLKINNIYFAQEIEKRRKKYYCDTILSIDKETGILPNYIKLYQDSKEGKEIEDYAMYSFFKNLNEKDAIGKLQLLSEKQLFEMTIDFAFEDIPYNFYQNLKLLLNYYEKIDNKFIPDSRLMIYNQLYHYETLDISSKISLFENLMKIGSMVEIFYDDFSEARKICYMNLNNSLMKKDELEKLKSKEFTRKYDVPVYELKGEKFNLLVTSTKMSRDYPYDQKNRLSVKTSSTSFISDSNIKTFSSPYDNIVLCFSSFDSNRVIHLYPSDSYSSFEYGSDRISKLYTPEELQQNTVAYNEMLYSNISFDSDKKLEPLEADYIVCYDTIEKGDLAYSKANGNIPIILLHSSYYRQDTRFPFSDTEDTYFPDKSYIEQDYYKKK